MLHAVLHALGWLVHVIFKESVEEVVFGLLLKQLFVKRMLHWAVHVAKPVVAMAARRAARWIGDSFARNLM